MDLGHQLSSCHKLQHLCVIPDIWPTQHSLLVRQSPWLKQTSSFLDFEGSVIFLKIYCIILCQQLRFLHHLKHLELSEESRLDLKLLKCLAESITFLGIWPSFERVIFGHDCSIEGSGAEKLMASLKNCGDLEKLDFSKNHIGSESARRLAESITIWGHDQPLKELNLTCCNIEGSGAEKFMTSLKNCKFLKTLKLCENHIGSESAKRLAESITLWGQDHPLKELYLSSCSIEGSGAEKLMESLQFL